MSAQNASSSFFLDIPYPRKGQSWQDKRASLISDLINSERQYAQHLYHFVYEYRVALADASSRNLIMNLPPATEELFSKVEPIYVLNLSFLSLLEKSILCSPNVAWEPAMALIGECFKHFITGIKTNYSDYAKSFPEGMNALNNQFETDPNIIHAIGSCQSNVGVTLIECLRSPLERISRYKSLLLMLLEVTPREHNDREDLVSAYINISPMSLAYRFFVVHQSYPALQKINAQYPNLGLQNTNIGPLVPGVPSIPMDLKSPSSRYLVFHEDEMQCFNGTRVISCQIWLFTDCVMIAMPSNANPVLFEFNNIKATPAELPSSFLHSIIDSESNTSNTSSSSSSKVNITLNVNENSSDNCADFFTDVDSFRVIFNEAKRRDVFIEACSNLRIDMNLDEVDSKIDETNPLAPIWTNLQDVTDCMLCGRVFGIVTQRIHCMYCRQVFCKRCVRRSATNHVICRNCDRKMLGDKVLPHMNINYKLGGFFNRMQQRVSLKRKRTLSQTQQNLQNLPQNQQQQKPQQQHSPLPPQPLQQQSTNQRSPASTAQLQQHSSQQQFQQTQQQQQQSSPQMQQRSQMPQNPQQQQQQQSAPQTQQRSQMPQNPQQQQQQSAPQTQQRSQMPQNPQQQQQQQSAPQMQQRSQMPQNPQQQQQQRFMQQPQNLQQQQRFTQQAPHSMQPGQQQKGPQLHPPSQVQQPHSPSQIQQPGAPTQQRFPPQQQLNPQQQQQQQQQQQRPNPQQPGFQQRPMQHLQSQPTIPPQLNKMQQPPNMQQNPNMQQRPMQPGVPTRGIQPQGVQQFRQMNPGQMPGRPTSNNQPQGIAGFNHPAQGQRAPGVPNPQQVGAKLPQNPGQQQQFVRPAPVQQFQQMQPGQPPKTTTPPSPK